ncbi:hypothetical protein L798_14390 [Zootermopsis nevadensis]|uniref:Uncharacterized protein n=1 Tax=Zootermopsis nevadensis TaxID=136037 RepID=A0A067QR00_ZOONE|nr:hypothetical protein L798_14390 [Zootermopsis nevadensis]
MQEAVRWTEMIRASLNDTTYGNFVATCSAQQKDLNENFSLMLMCATVHLRTL